MKPTEMLEQSVFAYSVVAGGAEPGNRRLKIQGSGVGAPGYNGESSYNGTLRNDHPLSRGLNYEPIFP